MGACQLQQHLAACAFASQNCDVPVHGAELVEQEDQVVDQAGEVHDGRTDLGNLVVELLPAELVVALLGVDVVPPHRQLRLVEHHLQHVLLHPTQLPLQTLRTHPLPHLVTEVLPEETVVVVHPEVRLSPGQAEQVAQESSEERGRPVGTEDVGEVVESDQQPAGDAALDQLLHLPAHVVLRDVAGEVGLEDRLEVAPGPLRQLEATRIRPELTSLLERPRGCD